ncbi:tail fiber assembly protein [Xenorhabdus szentirmaii]|uniref:tail fiber assembly protein n=1 Tax=Xenorhabdus szentirmaii TaxID=290112 RepID=UPI0019A4E45E|nr:tail fiber assembly protein [Xenorhabdus sp. 38]MBD2782797.1 tail fiber assembly protein [Xenorhabdus sp. 38]
MNNAVLGKNNIATLAGNITVYNYSEITGEYLSTTIEYLAVGVGIPAHSCTDEPPIASTGMAICRTRDNLAWERIPDHRGKTAYHTGTQQALSINYIGELEPEHILLAPKTQFDKWDGTRWVTDTAKQREHEIQQTESQKQYRMSQTLNSIAPLQYAVDLDMATDGERAALTAWKKYYVLLNRVDCSAAPDIDWPNAPE